ncbi:hypothetical protein PF005_g15002 [Phytophthora fragariae]|uniref:Secreted protein n=1 Tax=Phytophthora fragariae TaxID=53985 RepID=A0A6A3XL56_9STRA|nr:hypothetical protein PF003_g2167 [Phytophthora fragariae]KAE8933454.1 hypothetical protein PF009_g16547 [Phytophthora fragariae]KAE9000764.1 hypothetical protein PF011_g14049 [Phytophthora fragariae]KAE9099052.1 hypothetical protein PF010_g15332 [Phytophthora fragariae]KAE9099685.1 hypothetical protein PF007_g15789 [Phytophthora fragariae]
MNTLFLILFFTVNADCTRYCYMYYTSHCPCKMHIIYIRTSRARACCDLSWCGMLLQPFTSACNKITQFFLWRRRFATVTKFSYGI